MDTSTIGFTVMVLFTVMLVPFGVLIVRLFSRSPTAFAFTLTVITAFVVEMFVITQVMVWPFLVSPTTMFAPVIFTVSMNSNPSCSVSITVMLSV